ncbi:hypothetical protein FN846DRAFT_360091 [Sphaerosporella brunnea]|uniref:Uncharacterized protein n=1 Tax=Sphaerosporella brunnea TaxID=1250544 RepID=A0A5J5F643_9PEZI|nr:hypothetical protein FN846DRAFT_360091 [Sphaerosporella brunnea]
MRSNRGTCYSHSFAPCVKGAVSRQLGKARELYRILRQLSERIDRTAVLLCPITSCQVVINPMAALGTVGLSHRAQVASVYLPATYGLRCSDADEGLSDTGYRVVPQEAEGKDDYVEGPACVSRLQTDWRAMGRIRFGFDTYRRLYSQMASLPSCSQLCFCFYLCPFSFTLDLPDANIVGTLSMLFGPFAEPIIAVMERYLAPYYGTLRKSRPFRAPPTRSLWFHTKRETYELEFYLSPSFHPLHEKSRPPYLSLPVSPRQPGHTMIGRLVIVFFCFFRDAIACAAVCKCPSCDS